MTSRSRRQPGEGGEAAGGSAYDSFAMARADAFTDVGPPGAERSLAPDLVFYDGGCALCHAAVRFFLARDADGRRFRFGPQTGTTFARLVSADQQAVPPRSVIVQLADGQRLTRSTAVLHLLRRLGGAWGALAGVLSLVPRPLRDVVYDAVARARYRLFGRAGAACPVAPPKWRDRFVE